MDWMERINPLLQFLTYIADVDRTIQLITDYKLQIINSL